MKKVLAMPWKLYTATTSKEIAASFVFESARRMFLGMIAKKEAWLVFDLSNGDEDSKYYVWWFPTRKKAREHIAWQKQQRGADLSAPIKFIRKDK